MVKAKVTSMLDTSFQWARIRVLFKQKLQRFSRLKSISISVALVTRRQMKQHSTNNYLKSQRPPVFVHPLLYLRTPPTGFLHTPCQNYTRIREHLTRIPELTRHSQRQHLLGNRLQPIFRSYSPHSRQYSYLHTNITILNDLNGRLTLFRQVFTLE